MGVWHDMSFLRFLTLALSLGLAFARCPESWWTFGNSCYHNSGATMTWAEARAYCRGIQGGYLVEIESEEEEQALVGAFAIYDQDYWIGLTDQDSEGEWVWADINKPPKYRLGRGRAQRRGERKLRRP